MPGSPPRPSRPAGARGSSAGSRTKSTRASSVRPGTSPRSSGCWAAPLAVTPWSDLRSPGGNPVLDLGGAVRLRQALLAALSSRCTAENGLRQKPPCTGCAERGRGSRFRLSFPRRPRARWSFPAKKSQPASAAYRIELAPNCSLTPQSARWFVGGLAAVTFAAAGYFALAACGPSCPLPDSRSDCSGGPSVRACARASSVNSF